MDGRWWNGWEAGRNATPMQDEEQGLGHVTPGTKPLPCTLPVSGHNVGTSSLSEQKMKNSTSACL
eukprot:scaffold69330_cov23-Tisochrysis_lutea.AAC.1